ncbi:hypothetical protein ACQEVY_25505 [Streptomyces sp. CA-288835]|uniref:hypothetical protein n=1 Tax=Streptomyces sp. CA-288835 TaxID=3240069 RepID=UPI003D8C081D
MEVLPVAVECGYSPRVNPLEVSGAETDNREIGMRKRVLPDNAELLKKVEAGMTHEDIAKEYGVSHQAVTKHFNSMGEYRKGPQSDVTSVLPWDLSNHPQKQKISCQRSFLGLRAFLRERMGLEVSRRSQQDLRAFLNHVERGEVLELDDAEGARYVQRDPVRDGSLVIRWPAKVPKGDRTDLFHWEAGQDVADDS